MTPLLACAALNFAREIRDETQGGLAALARTHRAQLPAPGEPLYAYPSEMIPYYARTLAQWKVERIERLADAPTSGSATVLRLNVWDELRRERDVAVGAAIDNKVIAEQAESTGWVTPGGPFNIFTLHQLKGLRGSALKALAARGWRLRPMLAPEHALETIDITQLRRDEGWNKLEADGQLHPMRWTALPVAQAHLDLSMEPGFYRVQLTGMPYPQFEEVQTLTLGLKGEKKTTAPLEQGWFDRGWTIEVRRRHEKPVLEIGHPVIHPRIAQSELEEPWLNGLMIYGISILPGQAQGADSK
jgi:hypothetical protein